MKSFNLKNLDSNFEKKIAKEIRSQIENWAHEM